MTTINKATFNTVASFNRRLQEHSEEVRPQTQATRPKTISEVQESLRPNTAGSILGRLGRPQIGRQLTQYTPPPQQIEQQPQPQQRRLTTYTTFGLLDTYRESGQRIKEILNRIEMIVWGFGVPISISNAIQQTRELREELARRMEIIINNEASKGGYLDATTENELRGFFDSLSRDIAGFINNGQMHYNLVFGSNQTYGTGRTYIDTNPNNIFYDVVSYGLTSHRITNLRTPTIRLNYPQIQREERKQEETKQPDPTPEQPEAGEVVVTPGGDAVVPPIPSNPPFRPNDADMSLSDDEYARKYLEGVDYEQYRNRTIQFTQTKTINGQFEGVALGEPFVYPINYNIQTFAEDKINEMIGLLKNIQGAFMFSPMPEDFVWYGPGSRNNAFAIGYADLVAFFHDCMYANQGASGINQNVEADRKSIKMSKIIAYFLRCRKAGRIPIFEVNVVINGVQLLPTRLNIDSEIIWLEIFNASFKLLGWMQEKLGRGQELQPIQFTENQFLDYRFLIRHQKLKILYSYAVAINNNDVDFREAVPDPTFSGFLQKAETYYYYKNIQSANWGTIYNAFNNAVIKLDNELSRMTGTTQPDQVRRQYYTIIRNFMTVASVCVKTYYIDKRQKPANDWELRLSQDMREGEQPDAQELENIDEPISDIIAPVIYNEMAGDNRFMFLLRNMRVEGVVCY